MSIDEKICFVCSQKDFRDLSKLFFNQDIQKFFCEDCLTEIENHFWQHEEKTLPYFLIAIGKTMLEKNKEI